jgi:aminopeptidase YwaD
MFKISNQLFTFFLLISFVISVSAQTAKSDLVEQNLRKHVSYLASDNLEGRRTGEKGATAAAGYVANMFANYKLKGGFAEKGRVNFLQPFPYTTAVSIGAENRLMVTTASNNRVAELQTDWMPFGASPNANLIGTDTVFVGYGIVSSESKRDDYAGKNVTGKVVFAFDGSPEKDNPHSVLARFNTHAKAKIAKDNGAVALVLISRETNFSSDKQTKLDYDPTLGETAVPVVIVSRSVGAMMLGDDENLTKAEKGEAIAQVNLKTLVKVTLNKKSGQSYNVIGVLEGTDAALKNEAIIIGAHYDHLGRGGAGSLAVNSAEIHHGADDNASGTAALVELARQFAANKNNKRTLIFIAFGGEEEGLLGSKYYVNNPVFPLEKTVAMINMDMVGRLTQNKLTVGGIGTASEWKSLVESKNTATFYESIGITDANGMAKTITSPYASVTLFALQFNEDGFGPSDHSSFYGKQIPVLFFFTGTHLDYHKPSDTAEKINYAGLNQITNYVSEIVKAIDMNSKRPSYTVAKSSGMSGGRTGFNVSLGTIPSYAESNDGLILDGVRDDSPAAKAGIKAGDKIISLAGKEIRNVSDYTVVLGELKAGTEYEIIVIRGNEKLSLKIIPAARK